MPDQESFVQLQPDSTGKKLRGRENTSGSIDEYVRIAVSDDGPAAGTLTNPIATQGENKTYKTALINHGTIGDNTIVAAVAGKRIKVYAIVFVSTGTVNAKWKDGAATDLTGDMNFQAREGYTLAVTPPKAFLLATTAGNALILNLSAGIATDGWIAYWDDDTT